MVFEATLIGKLFTFIIFTWFLYRAIRFVVRRLDQGSDSKSER